jgi:uncharacterized membrane protein YeaQ/YmgE (transglycosylase-associated protein family)
MGLIGMAIVGLIAGALARAIVPGRDPMGCLLTMLLGIGGSFVGGFLASLLFDSEPARLQPVGLIGSVIGAIILLLVWRQFAGGRVGRR